VSRARPADLALPIPLADAGKPGGHRIQQLLYRSEVPGSVAITASVFVVAAISVFSHRSHLMESEHWIPSSGEVVSPFAGKSPGERS